MSTILIVLAVGLAWAGIVGLIGKVLHTVGDNIEKSIEPETYEDG